MEELEGVKEDEINLELELEDVDVNVDVKEDIIVVLEKVEYEGHGGLRTPTTEPLSHSTGSDSSEENVEFPRSTTEEKIAEKQHHHYQQQGVNDIRQTAIQPSLPKIDEEEVLSEEKIESEPNETISSVDNTEPQREYQVKEEGSAQTSTSEEVHIEKPAPQTDSENENHPIPLHYTDTSLITLSIIQNPSSSNETNEVADPDLQRVQSEWDEVERRQQQGLPLTNQTIAITTNLEYQTLQDYLTSNVKMNSEPKKVGFIDILTSCFSFKPKLYSPTLNTQYDTILAITKLPFEDGDSTHAQVLFSLYSNLMNTKTLPLRYGSHWEEIGFQGNDPATDLRGIGMLGLLQLFYLTQRHTELSLKIHQLSRLEGHDFPFCVVGINITRIVIQSLRSGSVFSIANKEPMYKQNLWGLVNNLYIAIFSAMYEEWMEKNYSIIDFPPLLNRLTNSALKNPLKLLQSHNF